MKLCPRCHLVTMRDEDEANALSRRDNKTYICNDCGEEEALIDSGDIQKNAIEREFVRSACESAESSKQ